MKKYFFIVAVLLFLPLGVAAFTANQGCGAGECADCHKLGKQEAEKIIKKGLPKGKVTGVKMSPVKGLWQVDLDVEGQHAAVFIDFEKKHVLAVSQIAPIETIGKPAPKKKITFSKIPLDDALVLGSKEAKKKVVVFTDPDCQHCRNLHFEIKQVLSKRNDAAFYLILYPLPIHPDAHKKAQAILCEKSVEMADNAYAGLVIAEPRCSSGQVEKNIALAKKLGIVSTPTLVRDDGAVHGGYLPADKLSEWIDGK